MSEPLDIGPIEERAGEDAGYPADKCVHCGGPIPDDGRFPVCSQRAPEARMPCVEPSAAEVARHDRVLLLAEVKALRADIAKRGG
jgi:predicted nucleic acid-binding Zn ribbon protein